MQLRRLDSTLAPTGHARFMSIGFGSMGPALFKFIVVTLGSSAIADVLFFALRNHIDVEHYMIAGGLFLYLVLVGAPMDLIFELDLVAIFLIVGIHYGCRILAVYTFFGPRGVCLLKVNDHLDQTVVFGDQYS